MQVCESLLILHLGFFIPPAFYSGQLEQTRLMRGMVDVISGAQGVFLQQRFFNDIGKIRRMQQQAHGEQVFKKDDYKVFEVCDVVCVNCTIKNITGNRIRSNGLRVRTACGTACLLL